MTTSCQVRSCNLYKQCASPQVFLRVLWNWKLIEFSLHMFPWEIYLKFAVRLKWESIFGAFDACFPAFETFDENSCCNLTKTQNICEIILCSIWSSVNNFPNIDSTVNIKISQNWKLLHNSSQFWCITIGGCFALFIPKSYNI